MNTVNNYGCLVKKAFSRGLHQNAKALFNLISKYQSLTTPYVEGSLV